MRMLAELSCIAWFERAGRPLTVRLAVCVAGVVMRSGLIGVALVCRLDGEELGLARGLSAGTTGCAVVPVAGGSRALTGLVAVDRIVGMPAAAVVGHR
jgi:hypothetical protein